MLARHILGSELMQSSDIQMDITQSFLKLGLENYTLKCSKIYFFRFLYYVILSKKSHKADSRRPLLRL